MKIGFCIVAGLFVIGCAGGGGSDGSQKAGGSSPAETSPKVQAAMDSFANDLLVEDVNEFAVGVRNSVDQMRSAFIAAVGSSQFQEIELIVSTFEKNVAAAVKPTQAQIIALQEEGVSANAAVRQLAYISNRASSAYVVYPQDLRAHFQKMQALCADGRYGQADEVTKRGFVHEQVKELYQQKCRAQLESLKPVVNDLPADLSEQDLAEISAMETKWSVFEKKTSFSQDELSELVRYATKLPASLMGKWTRQGFDADQFSKRIQAAQDKVLALIIEYRRVSKP